MRIAGKCKKRAFQHTYRKRSFISRDRYERLCAIYDFIKSAADNRVSRMAVAEVGMVSESVATRDLLYLEDTGVLRRVGTKWPMKYEFLQPVTVLESYISCLDEFLGVGEFREE